MSGLGTPRAARRGAGVLTTERAARGGVLAVGRAHRGSHDGRAEFLLQRGIPAAFGNREEGERREQGPRLPCFALTRPSSLPPAPSPLLGQGPRTERTLQDPSATGTTISACLEPDPCPFTLQTRQQRCPQGAAPPYTPPPWPRPRCTNGEGEVLRDEKCRSSTVSGGTAGNVISEGSRLEQLPRCAPSPAHPIAR